MIDAVLLMLFQVAAGAPADAPQATTAATTEQAAEPELVCRREFATGSRVKKVKVCRPKNQSGMDQDTVLQRELAKNGDQRRPGETGGGVSSGSGIGN